MNETKQPKELHEKAGSEHYPSTPFEAAKNQNSEEKNRADQIPGAKSASDFDEEDESDNDL